MELASLRVLHWTKAASNTEIPTTGIAGGLYLNSCQRVLWICCQESLPEPYPRDAEVFEGTEAYRFLLRVACGLESQVIGETDIFGQLREAWKQATSEGLNEEVDFWVQKVFEDTKEIRSQHLEHLGGLSYGSLVRKFMKEVSGGVAAELRSAALVVEAELRSATLVKELAGPILLIGAGQLAASVAPFLSECEVWLANRTQEKLRPIARDLGLRNSLFRILETAEEQEQAWGQARHVVVCVPGDPSGMKGLESWKGQGILLHLGVERARAGVWADMPGVFFLDDLFELQRTQGLARSRQVRNAIRACDERAKLRALGGSVHIAHGWEDLAIFA